MHDCSANDKGISAGCGERQPAERLQGAAAPTLTEQSHPPSHALGLLEQLPADLLASYIWGQLPRRDRKLLRQAGRSVAQYAASELMRHLQVRVCRASLLQLTSSGRTLHQRFPHPASLELRLLPPPARRDAGDGAAADGGWHGSTAVMSYFLSELGVATSVTSLSLQGWQELSPRDLHHVAATYPRLARLHLAGLPYNNYLSGSALASLAAAAVAAGATGGAGGRGGPSPPSGPSVGSLSPSPSASPSASSTRAPPGCCSQLQEVVVDTQLLMEPQAALVSLSRLPQLVSLELTGVPLLPSLEEDALPLSRLTGLTRLVVTFEHKHAQSERQLGGLAGLTGLRHLGLDFMQLGTGSSLWSAGWLLTHVLGRLTRLTSLHLPRAFLYDKSHPYFLQTLAAMPGLTDLALGSIILSPETAAAAATATLAGATPGGVGGGAAAAAAAITPSTAGRLPAEAGASTPGDSVTGDNGGEVRAEPASPPPTAAGVAALPPPSLARPWRRLALGAAMPCYLEDLLPLLLGPAYDTASPSGTFSEEGRGAGQPATPGPALAAASPPATPACVTPFRGGAGGTAGGGGAAAAAAAGGLNLLELSTPCTLQMVQLLPRFVRRTGAECTTATPAAAEGSGAGTGAGAGVGEVRLMLRLSANWAEVLAAAAAVGPALTSLALLPTYLYGSGTMMTPQVVLAVATSLPLLEHLELYRLNTDPRDVACLADMPRLRYVLLGVADEARERRGAGHPESLVRSLLAALHAKRSRGGSTCSTSKSGSSTGSSSSSSSSKDGSDSGKRSISAVGGATDARGGGGGGSGGGGTGGGGGGGVVVCCPELSEDDAARLDELCELEFGMYDMYGSRLRVERWQDGSLPWRLAVGCSLAPGRWRGRD